VACYADVGVFLLALSIVVRKKSSRTCDHEKSMFDYFSIYESLFQTLLVKKKITLVLIIQSLSQIRE